MCSARKSFHDKINIYLRNCPAVEENKNELAFIKYMHAPQQCKNKKMTRVEGCCIYTFTFFSFSLSLSLSVTDSVVLSYFFLFYLPSLLARNIFISPLFFRFLFVEKYESISCIGK